jgi:hypothetical protein
MRAAEAPLRRRDFLRLTGQTALAAVAVSLGLRRAAAALPAAATGPAAKAAAPAGRAAKSVVDVVACPRVMEGLQVDSGRTQEMIEEAIMALADAPSRGAAWAHFVKPGQRLALKFSSPLGANLGTEHAMLAATLFSLRAAGHSWGNIRVIDCAAAHYFKGLADVPVGWSDQTVSVLEQKEQLRRYLQDIDAIINIPCLGDHRVLGVACALENVTLPFIRRPGRYLGDDVHQAVVQIAAEGVSARPVVLTLANVLRGVFDEAPGVQETTAMPQGEVWVSTDMVAIDTLAAQWVENQRRRAGLPSLAQAGRPPKYLALAQNARLGNADLRNIVRREHRV